MEENIERNKKIQKAFQSKYGNDFEIVEIKEDSVEYYLKEGAKFIIWGVKYTIVDDKLVFNWDEKWHPKYPYERFDHPDPEAKIDF